MKGYFFNTYRDNRGLADLAPFFNNQEFLWNKLENIGNNPLKKYGINVLTMRLLFAQDALSNLKEQQLSVARKTGQYTLPITTIGLSGVPTSTLYPDPSTGNTGEIFTIETIRIHEYFYTLTISLMSSLDWLANEINEIYSLGIKRPDWGELCKKLKDLEKKNTELKSIIENSNNDTIYKLLFDYRNVIEHEGVVKIVEAPNNINDKVVIDLNYAIMVQDDPRNKNSPINTKLLELSQKFFNFVVGICDQAYGAEI